MLIAQKPAPFVHRSRWLTRFLPLVAVCLLSRPVPAAAQTVAETPTTGPTATATAIPPEPEDPSNVTTTDDNASADGGTGGKNIVILRNHTDGRLRMRGSVQLTHIPGPDAQPENLAYALGSCTDCQTLAVALQIALISPSATTVAPQNAAVALTFTARAASPPPVHSNT